MKKLIYIYILILFGFYQNANAQAELNLNSNLQCGTYTYCIDITMKATSGSFQLGTSSILLNYNTEALLFQSYTPTEFDSLGSCANAWAMQQIDIDAATGEFSLTMKLRQPNSTCIAVDTAGKIIGTLCFHILQQGASPDLEFNMLKTTLNSSVADNGTNSIAITNFGSIILNDELACDCPGIGVSCNDNNVFTTNDEYDINCDCVGQILDEDSDGIADGIDPCQDVHYEAEEAYYIGGAVATNHLQFFGNGFVDYQGWQGDTLEFTVTAIDTGTHDIAIRYSNGSWYNRHLQVAIDGIITHQNLLFHPTDTSWEKWDTILLSHYFSLGTHTILFTSNPNNEPNIDRITLSYCVGCLMTGQPCNDGDSCTVSDVTDINCNCAGVFLDADNDGVCNQADICPNGNDNLDIDNDGTPDACDSCNNNLIATVCDDGNPCTINDLVDANCNCVGTMTGTDSDNDGVCNTYDVCVGGDDNLDMDSDGLPDFCDTCDNRTVGMPCDDGNPCTVLDVYNATCGCGGIPIYVDISAAVNDVSCYGFKNGTINLSVAGAFGELLYEWNTNDSTSNLHNLAPGNYDVTVTDFRNCKDSANYIITQPDSLIIPYSIVASADSNGSIDLSPFGGMLPYSFVWESGDTSQDLTNLIPYTYNLTVTDANNCTQNLAIDVYPADMCVDTIMQAEYGILYNMGRDIWNERWALGNGFIYMTDDTSQTATYSFYIPTDGFYTIGFRYTDQWATRSAKILIDGAVEFAQFDFPRTYAWQNWQRAEFVDYLTAGTHQLVLAHGDDNWGPWIDFISICDEVAVPISLNANITNNICYADSAGVITVLPTGGTRNYSFLWNTGDTTATITNLLAGDYYITVTDEVGQTTIDTFTVGQPTEITPVFTVKPVKCKGQNNGRADVNVTGGTLWYSYAWSNGQTWKSTYNVISGNYTLTVTDGNGCIDVSNVFIPQPDTMDAIFVNTVSNGNDGTINLTPLGGNPPYTFFWIDSTLTKDRANLAVGNYRITITDTLGCQLKTATSIYPAGLCLDTIMEAENGIYQNLNYHIWYPDFTTGRGYIHFSNDTLGVANYTFSVAQDGYYGIGFRFSNQYSVPRNLKIEMDNIVEYTDFAFPPTSNWNIYQFKDFNKYLTAGTHTLKLKQRQDWSPRIDFITVCDLALAPFIAQTNITCHGDSTGAISVSMDGGREPYQYLWNNGDTTSSIQNLPVGTYWLQVSDSLNQVYNDTFDIIQPLPISPMITQINVPCNGLANGQATVNVSGGNGNYTYNWSNNATNNSIANLNIGTYHLTVTDNVGCVANTSVTITEPPIFNANLPTITNLNCHNDNSGSAVLNPNGGTTPYNFMWSNGQTTATATNLAAGNYTPTITDANGCMVTVPFVITQPDVLNLTVINTQNLSCNGNNSGQITTATTGGTGTYTFLWNTGQTTANLQNIAAGTYTLTATDINACLTTITQTITEPAIFTNQMTVTNIDCYGNANGAISVTANGANGNYAYNWNTGQTGSNLVNLQNGTYIVTITDNLGCVILDTAMITEPTILVANLATITNINCHGNNNGMATISGSGGTGNYTYSWNNGNNSATINNAIAGNYIGNITDANGCSDTILVTISQPNALGTTVANSQNINCNGANNGQITTNTTGGTGSYTFLWNTGQTTASLQNIIAGNYTLTATDANGCTTITTQTLTQPFALTAQVISTNIDCNGNANGSISVTALGGTGSRTFLWNTGQTTTNINNLQAGNYSVTITDSLGCSITKTATIIEPTPLALTYVFAPTTGSNGTINLSVSGGTLNYTFQWADGWVSANRTNLAVGNYYVTIADANICTISQRFTIYDATTCIDNIYQAEAATVSGATIVLNNTNGALDDGYADFGTDTTQTVTFAVTPTLDTMYEFSIRYTQGTTDKTLAISIDGNVIYPNLIFNKTIDWNTWNYATFQHNLTAGFHQIQLKNVGSDGPNIDYLSLCETLDTTTATIFIHKNEQISLATYPNPAKNFVNIDIQLATIPQGTLTILDVNGKIHHQEIIENTGNATIIKQINVENYVSGVYFVQLKTNKGNLIDKITIVK